MDHYIEDDFKKRLIDRLDIVMAIKILQEQGYDEEELIHKMTRIFYIDLDEYNEIVRIAA